MVRKLNPSQKIAQSFLAELKKYETVKDLKVFNILHMYPSSKLAFPNGYHDSQFFSVWIFDQETMRKMSLGKRHDGLRFWDDEVEVATVNIFVDGSTVLRFRYPVTYINAKMISIKRVEDKNESNFLFELSRFFRRLAR